MDVLVYLKHTAKAYPDGLAAIDGEVRLSWREYEERTRKLAAGLVQMGIQPGDRVAILMLNSFRYFEFYYGLPRMGALIVPLNVRFSPAELIYTINDSGANTLVVDDTFAPLVEKIKPELKTVQHFIFAGRSDSPPNLISYEALLEGANNWEAFKEVEPGDDDLLGLFYTGGTTGHPKGVMLTHRNITSNCLHALATIRQLDFKGNYLHVCPMFHLSDGPFAYAMTALGICNTFMPVFDPVKVLETIQREKVNYTLLVPVMVNAVLQVPNIKDYDLSSWKLMLYGAAPMPVEVLKKAMQAFPCQFVQGYGMTEASPGLGGMTWEDHLKAIDAPPDSLEARRLYSLGRPTIGVHVQVVNDQGREVEPGEIGEIVARGPNVMKGYWNLADETAYGLRDGWLHTGDMATVDEGGYIYIVDRKKDMIISGGENVYSVEVENALYNHPAVLEAAVIGVPDDKWGERVHAVVVLKPGQQATPEDIIAKCRELIAGYKVPRSVEFTDALPKSGAGKILKRNLRDKYWQGQARQVH